MADTVQPCVTRIYYLPNEILEQMMSYLDGISALFAVVQAEPQARLLFEARPRTILTSHPC